MILSLNPASDLLNGNRNKYRCTISMSTVDQCNVQEPPTALLLIVMPISTRPKNSGEILPSTFFPETAATKNPCLP